MAKITGLTKARKKMKARADAFSGRDPKIYTGISADSAESIKKNFNSQGRPAWKKRGGTYSHPILDKTGLTRDSAEDSVKMWYFAGHEYTMKVLSTSYAPFHQYGTSKLPVRAFVVFQRAELKKMQERFTKAFIKG